MNARNVTEDKIKIIDAVVKSLDCKELTAEEGGTYSRNLILLR